MRNTEGRQRWGEIRGGKNMASEDYSSPQSIFVKCYVLCLAGHAECGLKQNVKLLKKKIRYDKC